MKKPHATFPQTEIQNCIIHQLRNSSKYVSYKDLKALMADLKAVYAAVDEQAALDALDTFGEHWCQRRKEKYRKRRPENYPNARMQRRFSTPEIHTPVSCPPEVQPGKPAGRLP